MNMLACLQTSKGQKVVSHDCLNATCGQTLFLDLHSLISTLVSMHMHGFLVRAFGRNKPEVALCPLLG